MSTSDVALFTLHAGQALGARVADGLGLELQPHEEREFEWGQHKSRPLVDVRGRDVYVVESLHGDGTLSVNDRLCRLLFFLSALRDADARRVTAVVPFLCYSRKDQQTKPRDPVITRYVARLFEAAGTDRVATIEVHNLSAFQNAFRCPTVHIDAASAMAAELAHHLEGCPPVVVSPDTGGVKRARRYADALARCIHTEVPLAFVEKYRSEDVVTSGAIVGDIAGRAAVLVDDLIVGGTTLARAAAACRRAGATRVLAAAAHGAFVAAASAVLAAAPLDRLFVLDHIPPAALDPEFARTRLRLVDSAALIASAIREMCGGPGDGAPAIT
jgi:ribose-phosphate pyrophosphokinase